MDTAWASSSRGRSGGLPKGMLGVLHTHTECLLAAALKFFHCFHDNKETGVLGAGTPTRRQAQGNRTGGTGEPGSLRNRHTDEPHQAAP